MNVCLLTRYFNFKGSGVTRIASEFLTGLENRGHEVHKVYTNGTNLYSYFSYTALEIPLKLPRQNIDVYHALATLEAMWLPRDKSIATFLDLFTTTNPERSGAGMGYDKWKLAIGKKYFELGSQLATHCRFLVCISEKTKEDVITHLKVDKSKLRVIPLGIPEDLEPMNIKNKRFKIGTLGQLDKRKRIDLLIKQFMKSKIDADLLIAGQGMDKDMLHELAKDDDRIKFLGLVPNENLKYFYNSLDLFVFPTSIEGLGLPPIEAMACNKPVVILDDAIFPEDVRKHCISVYNFTELFNSQSTIDTILSMNQYQVNYKWAKSHSWDNCIDEHIKLYKEIAQ